MKYDKKYQIGLWFEGEDVFVDEDKVVESDEANDSNEMWINQFATTHLYIINMIQF